MFFGIFLCFYLYKKKKNSCFFGFNQEKIEVIYGKNMINLIYPLIYFLPYPFSLIL